MTMTLSANLDPIKKINFPEQNSASIKCFDQVFYAIIIIIIIIIIIFNIIIIISFSIIVIAVIIITID